nr:ParA family protein [Ensifer sp. SL37]
MSLCISTARDKGETGETSTAILIAGEFSLQEKRVLLTDADGRQNLLEWWKRSEANDNLAENIELVIAARQTDIEQLLENDANRFDFVVIDTPGHDTVQRDAIIAGSHIVLTPIPSSDEEAESAGQVAAAAETTEEEQRLISNTNFITRITFPVKVLDAYRLVTPSAQHPREGNTHVLDTDVVERNGYREIRNNYGALQMLELTDTLTKSESRSHQHGSECVFR